MASLKPTPTTDINENEGPVEMERPQKVDTDDDRQDGVRVAEAITSSWSKKSLIFAYAWWVIPFPIIRRTVAEQQIACGCYTLSMD